MLVECLKICVCVCVAVSCAGWVALGMTVAGPVRINMQPVNLYAPPVLVNCENDPANMSAGPVVTVIRALLLMIHLYLMCL